MYCPSCGKELSEEVRFCPACGTLQQSVAQNHTKDAPAATAETTSAGKRKPRIVHVLILVVAVLLGIVLLSRCGDTESSGYQAFIEQYFEAVASGNMNEVEACYNWDYVEKRNEENRGNPATEMFQWDSLAYYIESNDKYYRWYFGDEIESIRISQTTKETDSSVTRIKAEVYVVFEGNEEDVVAYVTIERGSSGWYVVQTLAYYAPDAA